MVKTTEPQFTKSFFEKGGICGNFGPLSQEIIKELSRKNKPFDDKNKPFVDKNKVFDDKNKPFENKNKPFIPPDKINTR